MFKIVRGYVGWTGVQPIMDDAMKRRLDGLLDAVTTLAPNHLQDWWEIQHDVLDRIRDEGLAVSDDEVVQCFRERGMDPIDIKELRRRLRSTA